MKRFIFVGFLMLGGFVAPAFAAVHGEEVDYKVGDITFKGYLAYDDAVKDKRPGVLVVHEWWGHNEYANRRARMLAELGYTALAVDMYGNGKTADNPTDATALTQEVNKDPEVAKARFLAAMDVLKNFRLTDPGRIAAIGYCFGGSIALKMAIAGVDLKGVVSFHGSLPAPQELGVGMVKSKVLICNGAADTFVTSEQISAYKQMLTKAGVDYQFIDYADAKHAFTNPEADTFAQKFKMPIGYNAAADQKSWQDMREFFKKIFAF